LRGLGWVISPMSPSKPTRPASCRPLGGLLIYQQ
jgi:hypothetical protein